MDVYSAIVYGCVFFRKIQKQPREKNSQENTCRPKACNIIKKETLAQVFSCEFGEISKNTFLTEHLWATASENLLCLKEDIVFLSYWFNYQPHMW